MSETYQLPADFKKITLQDIFNKAWEHFIIGDGKAGWSTEENRCMYLDEYGNKCAVGLCIPDGHPAQKERIAFRNLIIKYPELFDIRDLQSELANNFQNKLHDDLVDYCGLWMYEKIEMKKLYKKVAKEYGLTIPA